VDKNQILTILAVENPSIKDGKTNYIRTLTMKESKDKIRFGLLHDEKSVSLNEHSY
jgi:hypothetical protein